jgi:uncharacterized protein
MQLSRYLKVFPWEEDPDLLLLYSTKQASKILIKNETFRLAEKGMLSPEDESLLTELGMIVPDREGEMQAMLNLLDLIESKNKTLNITVVLNLDCNFACPYCYEGDMKGDLYMSDKTAEQLIGFIAERFTAPKKELLINFYGGEPLLSSGLIKDFSVALKSIAESREADYRFTLVTNGSLFKRRLAEELAALGLESVKITLDGPAHLHNKSRPFKSGAGTFETIIKNIKETCDLVRVGIGGNFERDNYKDFVLLLDYLEATGLTPDKISVMKFDPVMKYPLGYVSDYRAGCMSVDEAWLTPAAVFLREEILKRGYKTPAQRPSSCVVESPSSYVVNYDGAIYKCPAFIGKEAYKVGDIKAGLMDYASVYKLGIWKNDGCVECAYLPICFGGCRYMSFVRDGNINTLDCQKAYIDTSLEAFIRQEIKYNLQA